jgi:hypothetical protein
LPSFEPKANPGDRTYRLACPDCGGRLQIIAFIADDAVPRRILLHLGLDSRGSSVSPGPVLVPVAGALSNPSRDVRLPPKMKVIRALGLNLHGATTTRKGRDPERRARTSHLAVGPGTSPHTSRARSR